MKKKAIPPRAARLRDGRRECQLAVSIDRKKRCRDSHGTGHVVPDQVGVITERHEGLTDGGRDGVGQERKGLDDGPHVTRSLGVGVFEQGDRGEDLGETDQGVGTDLGPDVDRGGKGLR